ncbi:hypothetical protein QYF61_027737 [Mycteria americana]|uniref:Uncharacterized protein n=1 Tax=Mycteria americana TaxID=33587 RepID=A0AAN7SAL7_MYCAM|nr:hypothetical protein QYF61_027737 [Mycteria americana]
MPSQALSSDGYPGPTAPSSYTEHDIIWDGVRKVKVQLELNLARDAKNNKKGFYRYVSQKRKVKESVPQLMKRNGDLVSTDEEKAEVFNNFFSSVFSGNGYPHLSQVNGQHVGDQAG